MYLDCTSSSISCDGFDVCSTSIAFPTTETIGCLYGIKPRLSVEMLVTKNLASTPTIEYTSAVEQGKCETENLLECFL